MTNAPISLKNGVAVALAVVKDEQTKITMTHPGKF